MMVFRQLFRYIRNGFKNIGSNLFMTASSIFTLTITLSLCSLFVLFACNTDELTTQVENEIKIFAEFNKEVTEEQIQETIQAIEALPEVALVQHETKEEGYADFIKRIGANDEELATFFEETSDENPLPDSLVVSANNIANVDQLSNKLKEFSTLNYVDYGEESSLSSFVEITKSIRTFFSFVIIILVILAIFLIQNTIKLTIYSRRNELKIMKLVGASSMYVIVPFVVEGLIIGLFGALVPVLITIHGYQFLYSLLGGNLVIPMFNLIQPLPLVYQLSLGILAISVIVSLIGSFLAVVKHALKV